MTRFTSDFSLVASLPRKVLLVEDDATTLKAMTRVLIMQGYEVLSATNLKDAAALLVWQPDFVLLDLMLPDGSGLDLLSGIRRRDESARVAVLSAGPEDLLARAAELKPDAIFRKPVDVHRLLAWLKNPVPQSFKPHVVSFQQFQDPPPPK